MTTRTWNGSTDSFTAAADWTPTGVPTSGDNAVINSGTVSIFTAPTGVTIYLTEAAGATAAPGLSLTNVTLDSSTALIVTNNQSSLGATAPTLTINGTVTMAGTESFYGSRVAFTIGSGSTLVNSGALNFYAASPLTSGAGTLTNNGTIAIVNPQNATQSPLFGTTLNGSGQIALGENARVEFSGAVGSGQRLVFNDGSSGNETAQIDTISNFGATVSGFSSSDLIAVYANAAYTSDTYTSNGNAGTLTLYSGSTVIGSLNFAGSYTASSFSVSSTALGGGTYNLQITTSANNAVSSGLPSGYAAGSGSSTAPTSPTTSSSGGTTATTAVGAVYRFFDTRFGTHFFTADANERNTVLSTLSGSYTEETNGFGDIVSTNGAAVTANDSNATAVYRFFDTRFGTHFFTASASERDTILATRSDLTFESNSTFYEHATQQSSTADVAVYRFFDTQYGTHFYTGDATEYAGLTTPGSGTYRSNLTYEGVGFYAPAGSFK